MVINRPSGFRQHPEMVVHFPSGPRKQPRTVDNPPFLFRQHPEMVIPPPKQPETVIKAEDTLPDIQQLRLDTNDGTDDSEMLDRSTPESPESFQEHPITYEWETRILQNRDVLTKIEAEFDKVVATRTHLVKLMYLMEDHQEKVVEALESMECVMEELLSKDCDAIQSDSIPWTTRREMELIVGDMNYTISALYGGQGRSTTLMDVAGMILEEQLIQLL